MKEFKVGDMVRVVKDVNRPAEGNEIRDEDIGKVFEIERVLKDLKFPYGLKGGGRQRGADELELVDVEAVEKKEEYKQAINNLMEENKDLQERLDYADKQLERQADIINKLEKYIHEMNIKLVDVIKGE